MSAPLATGTAAVRLSGLPGRGILTARGHHLVVDSPAPLGGPNEELNPLDLLLGALAACGTFVCERAAQERGIRLEAIAVTAAGDFDPRGVCGDPVDPRLQAVRVRLELRGPTPAEAEALVAAFQTRCPVYTTLARATALSVEAVVEEL
ncbi:MAG TPA: OsmC family protein [Chloroflexaceae bacterium]|nr:OsmC family protein [Chloroflexaceae bacterium]